MNIDHSRRSTIKKLVGSAAALTASSLLPQTIFGYPFGTETDVEPVWGAIYFSAWNDGNKQVATMNKPEWYNRAPFYAELRSEDPYQLRINSETQDIMDQEILYASGGGLDFWAFYAVDENQTDRDRFLASQYKKKLKWFQVQGWWGDEKSLFRRKTEEEEVARLVKLFQDSQYLRITENRPVLAWYMPGGKGDRTPDKIFGSNENAKKFIQKLRDGSLKAGLGNPYIITLHSDANQAVTYLNDVGADAASTYAVGDFDFDKTDKASKWFRDTVAQKNKNVVLPLSCGWGGPHIINWGGSGPHEDEAQPTMLQWRKHLEDARDFIKKKPGNSPGGLTLIYNWSEYGEGGWLNADKSDGTDKLNVLKSVKNKTVGAIVWNFTFSTEGWTASGTSSVGLSPKKLDGVRSLIALLTEKDYSIQLKDQSIPLKGLTRIIIRLKNSPNAKAAIIRFQTGSNDKFYQVPFKLKGSEAGFNSYDIDLSQNPNWKGTLKNLFIEIGDGSMALNGAVEIDHVRLELPVSIPAAPQNPFPKVGQNDRTRWTGLAWTPSTGAVYYDVYFGTSEPLKLIKTTTGVCCEPGPLKPETQYSWKVVAKNGDKSTASPVWKFITANS